MFDAVSVQVANGDYSNLEEFEADLHLMWANAQQYNLPRE